MEITKLLAVLVVSASLTLGVVAQAGEKKHEEEENVSSSDVPAVVQKAAEKEAKGGKIIRWEKEGKNYEAVIELKGKEWDIKIDPNGKVLSKHEGDNDKDEKGEKEDND